MRSSNDDEREALRMSNTMGDPGTAAEAQVACALCNQQVPAQTTKLANGHRVCTSCALQLETELAQGSAAAADVLPRAALMGALGALVGAAVWAGVVIITEFEIGYLAVLVGFLAGYGVKRGAGGAHGPRLQKTAVACAVVGLLATKYFLFAHFFTAAAASKGYSLGYFSIGTIGAFPRVLPELLTPFDALWAFIALSGAWRVPAAPRVTLRG
jgi:hypothetical protein